MHQDAAQVHTYQGLFHTKEKARSTKEDNHGLINLCTKSRAQKAQSKSFLHRKIDHEEQENETSINCNRLVPRESVVTRAFFLL
eukprot:1031105-Ditylum_brightwellii.AAC.1